MKGGGLMESFAKQFAIMISMIDAAVFRQQALEVLIANGPPPLGRSQFGFSYDSANPTKSYYLIYSVGLLNYFEAGKPFAYHVMLEPDALARGWQKGLLAFTKQEMFLGAALHEVRHRVQFCLNVPLFNRSHTDKVLRCRYWGEIQDKHYKNITDGNLEFDAKFFECYGAHEFRQGRLKINKDDLGNLLCMTSEQFLEKEIKLAKETA